MDATPMAATEFATNCRGGQLRLLSRFDFRQLQKLLASAAFHVGEVLPKYAVHGDDWA
jgi:hydroxyacyl-ACP dehydratase HTD2-like protein with hotdog domain